MPIRHYLGTQDGIFLFPAGKVAAQGIAAQGQPFELIRMEGHTHWFYNSGEQIAANAWAWLDRQLP